MINNDISDYNFNSLKRKLSLNDVLTSDFSYSQFLDYIKFGEHETDKKMYLGQ